MACSSRTLVKRMTGMPLSEDHYDTQSGVPLPKGRCNAFKKSMIHDNRFELQFTLHFAAGRVLHRMPCRGIQRYQLYFPRIHRVRWVEWHKHHGHYNLCAGQGIPSDECFPTHARGGQVSDTLAPFNVVFETTSQAPVRYIIDPHLHSRPERV
jgi:hypothetical protein